MALLDVDTIDQTPDRYLDRIGDVFAVFDRQDSGNVSYGVRVGSERFFVKTAGDPASHADPDHAQRVALLDNAVEVSRSCRHPVLATVRHEIASPHGPMLVYDWADGELLGHQWRTPGSAFQRFRALPEQAICAVLDRIFDAHRALAEAGWIAVDFYLGSLLYDAANRHITLIDPDLYVRGPFINERGRMFGSSSLMAPEQFEWGARIDQATTVFTLGRLALLALGDGTPNRASLRGDDPRYQVVLRACATDRDARYPTVSAFSAAWQGVTAR